MTREEKIESERKRQLKLLEAIATPEEHQKIPRSRRQGRRLRKQLEEMEGSV